MADFNEIFLSKSIPKIKLDLVEKYINDPMFSKEECQKRSRCLDTYIEFLRILMKRCKINEKIKII